MTTQQGLLEARLAELEAAFSRMAIVPGKDIGPVAGFSSGSCTNNCTAACTMGCTSGCTGGCVSPEVRFQGFDRLARG